jgi:ribonuclease HI
MIEVYTDGAYSSSRNVGGWAFVITENNDKIHSSFGDVSDTTNNRMEIIACLNAMLWLQEQNKTEATIFTDSMYVIGTMTKNWKKKKNVDLWIKMFDVVGKLNINWQHIKGHSGNKWNEYCDMLAVHGSHIND